MSAPQGDPEIELWAVACALIIVGSLASLIVYLVCS